MLWRTFPDQASDFQCPSLWVIGSETRICRPILDRAGNRVVEVEDESDARCLYVPDPGVSRAHVRIVALPSGDWKVEDLGSRNGFKLNGVVISSSHHIVAHVGDILSLGRNGVTFKFETSKSSSESSPSLDERVSPARPMASSSSSSSPPTSSSSSLTYNVTPRSLISIPASFASCSPSFSQSTTTSATSSISETSLQPEVSANLLLMDVLRPLPNSITSEPASTSTTNVSAPTSIASDAVSVFMSDDVEKKVSEVLSPSSCRKRLISTLDSSQKVSSKNDRVSESQLQNWFAKRPSASQSSPSSDRSNRRRAGTRSSSSSPKRYATIDNELQPSFRKAIVVADVVSIPETSVAPHRDHLSHSTLPEIEEPLSPSSSPSSSSPLQRRTSISNADLTALSENTNVTISPSFLAPHSLETTSSHTTSSKSSLERLPSVSTSEVKFHNRSTSPKESSLRRLPLVTTTEVKFHGPSALVDSFPSTASTALTSTHTTTSSTTTFATNPASSSTDSLLRKERKELRRNGAVGNAPGICSRPFKPPRKQGEEAFRPVNEQPPIISDESSKRKFLVNNAKEIKRQKFQATVRSLERRASREAKQVQSVEISSDSSEPEIRSNGTVVAPSSATPSTSRLDSLIASLTSSRATSPARTFSLSSLSSSSSSCSSGASSSSASLLPAKCLSNSSCTAPFSSSDEIFDPYSSPYIEFDPYSSSAAPSSSLAPLSSSARLSLSAPSSSSYSSASFSSSSSSLSISSSSSSSSLSLSSAVHCACVGREPSLIDSFVQRLVEEWQCCICFEVMIEAKALPCGHVFCGECIEGWFAINANTCPACRASTPGQKPMPVLALDRAIELLVEKGFLPAEDIQKRQEKLAELKVKREEREATIKSATSRGLDPAAMVFASEQLALPMNQRSSFSPLYNPYGMPAPPIFNVASGGSGRLFNRPIYSLEGNLRSVPIPPQRVQHLPMIYKAEYSTGSVCRTCNQGILPGLVQFSEGLMGHTYHIHCYRPQAGSHVVGVSRLSADDQAIVHAILEP